jgi:predicted dithiol-disulfide oxidoreductase (DUF899 family)
VKREVALRREMEAVAAQLRALPSGGEVPTDYVFDCIGASGMPSKVRLSELFSGGDTLMLYHYMFPRHVQDNRQARPRGDGNAAIVRRAVPVVYCAHRHVGKRYAPLRGPWR